MEHVLGVYHSRFNADEPLVCMDETTKQLTQAVIAPTAAREGRPDHGHRLLRRQRERSLVVIAVTIEGDAEGVSADTAFGEEGRRSSREEIDFVVIAVADDRAGGLGQVEIEESLEAGDVGEIALGGPSFGLPATAVEGEDNAAVLGIPAGEFLEAVGESVAVVVRADAFVFGVHALAPMRPAVLFELDVGLGLGTFIALGEPLVHELAVLVQQLRVRRVGGKIVDLICARHPQIYPTSLNAIEVDFLKRD